MTALIIVAAPLLVVLAVLGLAALLGGTGRHRLPCGCVITSDGVQEPCRLGHDATFWAQIDARFWEAMERMANQ